MHQPPTMQSATSNYISASSVALCLSIAACGSPSSALDKVDASPTPAPLDASAPLPTDAAVIPQPDADTSMQADLTRFFPMAVGASWTYKVTKAGGIGSKVQTVLGYEDVGGMKAGTMAFKVQSSKPSGKITWSWQEDSGEALIRHREQTFAVDTTQQTEEFYFPAKLRLDELPAHLVLGASFDYVYTEKIHDFVRNIDTSLLKTETWTVEAIDVSVTVPAGVYSCIQLHKTNAATGSDKRYWFSVGVGKVKEQSASQTEELTAFSIP